MYINIEYIDKNLPWMSESWKSWDILKVFFFSPISRQNYCVRYSHRKVLQLDGGGSWSTCNQLWNIIKTSQTSRIHFERSDQSTFLSSFLDRNILFNTTRNIFISQLIKILSTLYLIIFKNGRQTELLFSRIRAGTGAGEIINISST